MQLARRLVHPARRRARRRVLARIAAWHDRCWTSDMTVVVLAAMVGGPPQRQAAGR